MLDAYVEDLEVDATAGEYFPLRAGRSFAYHRFDHIRRRVGEL